MALQCRSFLGCPSIAKHSWISLSKRARRCRIENSCYRVHVVAYGVVAVAGFCGVSASHESRTLVCPGKYGG